MLTQILWWTSNALIALLLVRAVRGKFFTKYLIFFLYLGHVLLFDLLRFYFYVFIPEAFRDFYWNTQFISLAVGYCVIWEIYRQVLAGYKGTARIAGLAVSTIFVVVMARVLSNMLSGPVWTTAETVGELERNLRTIQAFLIMAVLGLVAYYGTPIGRNLRGIILGYGWFIATSVVHLTLRDHIGDQFQQLWQYIQSTAYFVSLLIWTATLWSYQPNPKPEREIEIEHDYDLFSRRTAHAIKSARAYIVRTIRP